MNEQLPNDLVQALGRGSSLMLDNLGLPINVTTVHTAYAERIGKHPTALTADESAQAILEYIATDSALTATLNTLLHP